MATSTPTPSASDGANPPVPPPPPQPKGLRLWPAVILVALLIGLRVLLNTWEDMPPALFPVVFMGPLVLVLLLALWWLFASRAPLGQRWLAFLVVGAAAAATAWLSHPTIQGMIFQFYPLQVATVGFVLALLLLVWFGRNLAIWGAVLVSMVCFAAFLLLRNDGFTGEFNVAFDWRWKPSAEEIYLKERQAEKKPVPEPAKDAPAAAVKWAGFRGAGRDGVVSGVRLAEDWAARPPKEVWRRKIGPGWSSFAATEDHVYTQEQRGELEVVACYDANTGTDVWSHENPTRFWEAIAGAGPRATPTLHDGAVFTLGANGALLRLDARTGEVAWTRDLQVDADRKPPMWGFSSSPLVTHGLVIVHAGGSDDKGLLAYDAKTGEPRWKVASGDHSYSSPHLATVAGQQSVLILTNTGLRAHDLETGATQWDHEWKYDGYRVVQPLVFGDSAALLGTMVGAGTRRIDLKRDGSVVSTAERWTSQAMKPNFNDYVAHKGHLYGFDNNIFACVDLETGEKKWRGGRYGTGQVLLLPDGDQLLVLSEKGELVLLRATPERHEELARFPAIKGKTWNHPALVGNRVYVRNGEEAACFELSLAGSP
jgi:outer membrane protein assembly factor BamB